MTIRQLLVYIDVFIAGAATMSLEFLASRVIAPYYGTSFVVWLNLIGIFLTAMSLGSIAGGLLAEKVRSQPAFLLLSGGLTIGILTAVKEPALLILQQHLYAIAAGSFVAVLLLFSLPVILLSAIPPCAIALLRRQPHASESLTGVVYGISSLGSIAGVLMIPLLLPALGNTVYILLLAFILSALALPGISLSPGRILSIGLLFVVMAGITYLNLATFGRILLCDYDSLYNRIWIHENSGAGQKRSFVLRTGRYTPQSTFYPDEPEKAVGYIQMADKILAGSSKNSILILGGGGMQAANLFARQYPHTRIDVVEIDPDIPRLAARYFGQSRQHSNINLIIDDARTFLKNHSGPDYDAILFDVFAEGGNPPVHLTTSQFAKNIANALYANGIFILNIPSQQANVQSAFAKLYKNVFSQTALYRDKDTPPEIQETILVASNKRLITPSNFQEVAPGKTAPLLRTDDDRAPLFINELQKTAPIKINLMSEYRKTLQSLLRAI